MKWGNVLVHPLMYTYYICSYSAIYIYIYIYILHILSKNKKNYNFKLQFWSYKMWLKVIISLVFGNWIHLWNVTWNDVGSLSPVMNLASTYSREKPSRVGCFDNFVLEKKKMLKCKTHYLQLRFTIINFNPPTLFLFHFNHLSFKFV